MTQFNTKNVRGKAKGNRVIRPHGGPHARGHFYSSVSRATDIGAGQTGAGRDLN